MADRKTLEQHNVETNASNDGPFFCDNCKNELPAFALVDGSGIPELEGEYVCGTCIIDLARAKIAAAHVQQLNWDDVRSFRTLLLQRSDWTQTFDVSEAVRNKWAPIRAQLRDTPETYSDANLAYAALRQIEADHF